MSLFPPARALFPALALAALPALAEGLRFEDVTETHLPKGVTEGLIMDAGVADLDGDGDGDLDVLLANEFKPNVLLLNDGSGRFEDASDRIPQVKRDSEDVGFADFDGDGDLDAVVVTEDDKLNELYINDGKGRFSDASDRLPVTGTSNGVHVADVNGDGKADILVGNNGQNHVLIADGEGGFREESKTRLPAAKEITQDLELGDVDGDGDMDLVSANEGENVLLLNDGEGVFLPDRDVERIPESGPQHTRDVDFADVDADGDLDLVFANVFPAQDRLFLNDGKGHFTDVTATHLPKDQEPTFDIDLLDLDGDGDLDFIAGDLGNLQGTEFKPLRVYLNDGQGRFTDATGGLLPASAGVNGLDIEAADFNGDGVMDLYVASRGGTDRLLLGVKKKS